MDLYWRRGSVSSWILTSRELHRVDGRRGVCFSSPPWHMASYMHTTSTDHSCTVFSSRKWRGGCALFLLLLLFSFSFSFLSLCHGKCTLTPLELISLVPPPPAPPPHAELEGGGCFFLSPWLANVPRPDHLCAFLCIHVCLYESLYLVTLGTKTRHTETQKLKKIAVYGLAVL